jgi:hypothetical protein
MPEADVRAIVLDNGASQTQRPGYKPVWQLNSLTGRHVPSAIGLGRKLRTPEDAALDQPAEYQNGVNLLLQTLRDSADKVAIVFVGSARDVAAAYNRAPDLFRAKVRSIHGFIGEASDPKFIEYNVSLDPLAFARLIRADLPFYWVPCFDGGLWQNHGHASFWKIRHEQVLSRAPEPLQRYFLYMLRHETNDPVAYLQLPVNPEDLRWLMAGERNLWCGALLGLAVGRAVRHEGAEVAAFSPVSVDVSDDGVVRYSNDPGAHRIQRFGVTNLAGFTTAVTAATEQLLTHFPIQDRRRAP